jgi:lipid A ethanolaminephosphotransferase
MFMLLTRWQPKPLPLLWLIGLMALWQATLGNWPLWQALAQLPYMQARPLRSLLPLGLLLLCFNLFFFSLIIWSPWRRMLGLLLLVMSTSASYFMLSYGVVIDPSMLANVANTDAREVRDLLSINMVWPVLWGLILPGWWWWRQPVSVSPWRKSLIQRLVLLALALALTVGVGRFSFQELATTMRNHKSLRYMINPYNSIYGLAHLGVGQAAQAQQSLQPIGEDARFAGPVAASEQSGPLLVFVVGETLRAANVALGGYARDTSPRLMPLKRAGELVYFDQVASCGTNTQTSLPCMFSSLGRTDDRSQNLENLLDVLQRAGLAVLWMDNQSGCKGVCDRVANTNTSALSDPVLCPAGECFDEMLIKQLPEQLKRLDAQRQARATVAVLHMMGSHGPAYYKRTPETHKHFKPECQDQALQNCANDAVLNAYDNTARYTDHVLGELINWLGQQARPTALLFVSDHGESLGENGLYLHGMPYAVAPSEQTHVPMALWLSPQWQQTQQLSLGCLQAKASQALSHDNLFHTVLGMTQVHTALHAPALDITQGCRP